VNLVLDSGGIEYNIIRRSGKSTENILVVKHDGTKKLYTSKKDIDKSLEDLIGLNYENMLETFIVRQGELTSFIMLKPSERRNKLINLLNIDFKPIRDRIGRDLNDVRTKLSNYMGRKQLIEERFKNEGINVITTQVIDEKIKKLGEEIDKLRLNLEKSEKKYREIDLERSRLEGILNKIETIEKSIYEITDELSVIKNKIYTIVKDEIGGHDLSQLIKKFRVIDKEYESAFERLNILKEVIDLLRESLSTRVDLRELDSKIEGLIGIEDELVRTYQVKSEYESRVKTLKNNLNQLLEEEGRCPLCGSILPSDRREKLITDIRNEIARFSGKINELENKILELKEKDSLKSSLVRRRDTLKGKVKTLLEEINRKYKKLRIEKKLDIDSIEDEINYIDERIDNIERFLEGLMEEANRYLKEPLKDFKDLMNNVNNLEKYLEKLNVYSGRLDSLKNELRRLYETENVLDKDSIRRRLNILKREYHSLHDEISRLNKRYGVFKAEMEKLINLRREAQEYIEIMKEISRLEYEERILDKLYSEIFIESGFPLYYLELLVNKILTEYVNKYLRRLYPDLEVKYMAGKTGIELKVFMNGRLREINTLSGGEITLLGLATRLGLGELLTLLHSRRIRPGFLIVDEGFGPLDEENRLKVSEVFRRLVDESLYTQVIVISHERDMMDSNYFNSIIEVYKDRGYSRIELKNF